MYKENIKQFFTQTKDKKQLIELVANSFSMNPLSVKQVWFREFYQVPEKHQKRLIGIMQNYLKVEQSELITH